MLQIVLKKILFKQEYEKKEWKNSRSKYSLEIRGKDGQPLYLTKKNVTKMYGDFEKRKIETYEHFYSTFTKEQV